jgi:PrcB C-terminal
MMQLRVLAATVVLLLGNACADVHRVTVMTVLSHGNCQTTAVGVRIIDYAALAELRGSRLIGMTEAPGAEASPLHLIAIIPGPYPTPGYGLSLNDSNPTFADPLILRLEVTKPPADAVQAQMITHPCLVVGIDDQAVKRVRVVDDAAAVVGEVDVSKPQ